MSGRVIQGFFIGGAVRATPAVVRVLPVQRALPAAEARGMSIPRTGPPPAAFHPARYVAGQARPAPGRPAPLPAVVQRHGSAAGFEVDPVRLGLARGGGLPLPKGVLAKMEAAFRADFSAVRIHIGPQAARIGAVAFTTGTDIYFAPGRYLPETVHGQQLLGHELAHVVQQRQGRVRASGNGVSIVQDQMLEAEADRLGMQAAMSREPRPTASIQRAIAPGPPFRPIQRAQIGSVCDICGKEFASDLGVAIHKGKSHKGGNNNNAMDISDDEDEDYWSDWSHESLDSDDERKVFSTSRGTTQKDNYQNLRHGLEEEFHSSKGLAEAVTSLGGGNAPAANTHILVSGYKDGNRIRILAHSSTINSMKAMAVRYKGTALPAVQNIVGKKMHVHTEMYMIWILAGGNRNKIKNCMNDMHLVVDKPICTRCIKFVREAAPAMLDDGLDIDTDIGRGDFKDWYDPFDIKPSDLEKPRPDNPFG
jgi:hypothetical protein